SAAGRVVLDLSASHPAFIPPLQLDRLLGKILRNARQAIQGDRGRVFVRTRDGGGSVWIEIQDEGCGIPPEHLNRVFEPFFSTRGVGQGIGLGLTAAYGIARRHGGDIEVRSQPGRGATFSVRLLAAVAEGSATAA
ncbi:MAG TPA: ATP-binding protein, partial [Myxococcales bacterium]|nr:ATP-binding protein [Myxococcales bacterium]